MSDTILLSGSDVLTPGQNYTFVFSSGVNNLTELDVNQAIGGIDYLSPGTVNNHSGFGPFDIQFTYEGDGADTVTSVAQDIHDTVSHQTWGTFGSLQEARTGTIAQGPPPNAPPKPQTCGIDNIGACFPSSTVVIIVLVLVVAGIFGLAYTAHEI